MKYNGKTAVIGVNQGESADTVQEFGVRQAISYPLLVDDDNTVNLDYNINSLPTTIFIDADGVVQEVIVGIVNQAVLEDRIEGMMRAE
jgi:peroxiredoxin